MISSTPIQVQLCELGLDLLLDVFWQPPGPSPPAPALVGLAFLLPDSLPQTAGRLQLAVTSPALQPVGSLALDYLLVRPLPNYNEMDFSRTYRQHWAPDWSGLDVGHRGLGNSYTPGQHCSHIRENTLARHDQTHKYHLKNSQKPFCSMRHAIQHGADMVEFDVQLSRDLVPCIFHEFHLMVVTRAKQGGEVLVDVPVRDLSIEELQGLRSHHPSERLEGVKSFGEHEGSQHEHQSFPTLRSALLDLPPGCGFNIEVKYGQTMRDGTEETRIHQMEINAFLDPILECVLRHGGQRLVVFSSFNPDICTMIIHKQNQYPVLLLTQGQNQKYPDFRDPRTWSLRSGVLFAELAGLLGLSAMAAALVKDPAQLGLLRQRGQVLFCWTDEDNSKETVQYLKSLGVDGVIYDRVSKFSYAVSCSLAQVDQNKTEAAFIAEGRCLFPRPSLRPSSRLVGDAASCSPGSSPEAGGRPARVEALLEGRGRGRQRSSLSFTEPL
jgi:glycerophosphocholine phosphodiesterase GPCPD1